MAAAERLQVGAVGERDLDLDEHVARLPARGSARPPAAGRRGRGSGAPSRREHDLERARRSGRARALPRSGRAAARSARAGRARAAARAQPACAAASPSASRPASARSGRRRSRSTGPRRGRRARCRRARPRSGRAAPPGARQDGGVDRPVRRSIARSRRRLVRARHWTAVRQISPGNVVKPTGIGGGGSGWRPAAGASGP